MKSCSRCSNILTADAAYCYVCNSEQTEGFEEFEAKVKPNDAFLRVLCILTIVGAGFSLLSLPVSLIMTSRVGVEVPGYTIFLGMILAAGKLTGAFFMLRKKLLGLFIYTIAASCSILMSIYSMSTIADKLSTPIVLISALLSLIFIIAFLVMFWLPVNRKLLS